VEVGQLGLASGGGKPLPAVVRGKMEAALGADFSNVRVHVGPQAERIGAIAFTVGSDIYFAPGRYQPDTLQGQQLLGHELAHVVQQCAGRVRNPLGTELAVVHDRALEVEADRMGQRAATHRRVAQRKMPNVGQSESALRISPPISVGSGSYRLRAGARGREIDSVIAHARDKGAIEGTDLSVNEAHRGQGVGMMPITSAARTGLQFGRSKVTLAAQDRRSGHLVQWHRNMGFAQTGVNRHGYPQLKAPISRVLAGALQQQPGMLVRGRFGTIEPNPSIQRMKRTLANPSNPSATKARHDTVFLPNSPALQNWRRGVNAGFRSGWWDAVDAVGEDATPPVLSDAARARVGNPDPNAIAAVRANPPAEIIDVGTEYEHGREFGYGEGYSQADFDANRLLNWRRANYPAIPANRVAIALAMNHGNCVYCNVNPSTDADHVYPVQKHWVTLGSKGHDLNRVNDQDNLVGACQHCNISKSNIYLDQWNGKRWQVGQWFPFLAVGEQAPPQHRGSPINNPANW
jgi:5-methylcytosine-specific restriction endonuclease McrA